MGDVVRIGDLRHVRLVRDDVINGLRVLEALETRPLEVAKWIAQCQECGKQVVLRADLLMMGEPSGCIDCLVSKLEEEQQMPIPAMPAPA